MAAEEPNPVFTHDLTDGGAFFGPEAVNGTVQASRFGLAMDTGIKAKSGVIKQFAAFRAQVQATTMSAAAMPADH